PRHRRARASWNYLVTPNDDSVLVTYDVTRLMRLDGPRRFLVTLGGRDHVDPSTVLAAMTYSHPMYTPESVAAQQLLPTLDDDRIACARPPLRPAAGDHRTAVRERLPRLGVSRGWSRIGSTGGPPPRRAMADRR